MGSAGTANLPCHARSAMLNRLGTTRRQRNGSGVHAHVRGVHGQEPGTIELHGLSRLRYAGAMRLVIVFGIAVSLFAQTDRVLDEMRADYRSVRNYMIRSAEKMPGADYDFRPAPDVRTFAQQIAHVADDQYNLCAPVRGERRNARYREIELTLTTKEELVTALKKSFEYCDAAYDSVTPRSAAEIVPFGKTSRTRLSMLNWNTWHTWEHYGNLVVYFRVKRMVPPSSEPK